MVLQTVLFTNFVFAGMKIHYDNPFKRGVLYMALKGAEIEMYPISYRLPWNVDYLAEFIKSMKHELG